LTKNPSYARGHQPAGAGSHHDTLSPIADARSPAARIMPAGRRGRFPNPNDDDDVEMSVGGGVQLVATLPGDGGCQVNGVTGV